MLSPTCRRATAIASMRRNPVGARVYVSFCAQCHGAEGAGVPNVFPRLAGNPSVITEDTTSLIRLMVEGGNSPATIGGPPRQAMPGFAQTLTNAQMASVLSWIRSSWGNDARPVTANDIQSLREENCISSAACVVPRDAVAFVTRHASRIVSLR